MSFQATFQDLDAVALVHLFPLSTFSDTPFVLFNIRSVNHVPLLETSYTWQSLDMTEPTSTVLR